MLLFPKVFLLAGVATGISAAIFYFRPGSDLWVAQLTPVELEQLRHQIRHRDDEIADSTASHFNELSPTLTTPDVGQYQFKSGLTPQERQALREQVRGVTPDLRLGGGASESVAVNESYPDGLTIPADTSSGAAGRSR